MRVGDAAFLTFVRITEKLEDSSVPDTHLWAVFDSSESHGMSYEIRGHDVQKGKIRLINYTALTYLFISSGKQMRRRAAYYIQTCPDTHAHCITE